MLRDVLLLSCTWVSRAFHELNLLLFSSSPLLLFLHRVLLPLPSLSLFLTLSHSLSLSLTLPLPQGNLRRNDAEDKLGGRWKDEEKFVSEQDTWEAHQVKIQFNF